MKGEIIRSRWRGDRGRAVTGFRAWTGAHYLSGGTHRGYFPSRRQAEAALEAHRKAACQLCADAEAETTAVAIEEAEPVAR